MRLQMQYFFLLLLLLIPLTAEAQSELCDMDTISELLLEIQTAHQNEDLAAAGELLATAIETLDVIKESCSIDPLSTVETSATPLSSTSENDDPLKSDRSSGFYLVGIDIIHGRWESTGTTSNCYWARTNVDGDTLANHFGMAGGTLTIQESDFQIEIDDCGIMVYVEDTERSLADDADSPKESGFYTVGVEIMTGLWRSLGTGDSCYVARLDEEQDTIDNHFGTAGITINILPSDYEVEFSDCGTWEYLGQP